MHNGNRKRWLRKKQEGEPRHAPDWEHPRVTPTIRLQRQRVTSRTSWFKMRRPTSIPLDQGTRVGAHRAQLVRTPMSVPDHRKDSSLHSSFNNRIPEKEMIPPEDEGGVPPLPEGGLQQGAEGIPGGLRGRATHQGQVIHRVQPPRPNLSPGYELSLTTC